MAIIKEGVLRRAVVTLWAAISLSYLCLLHVGGSGLTGLENVFLTAVSIVAAAFAANACEQLLKAEQHEGNSKEWWGLAYEMLKVPAFSTAVFIVGLTGFAMKGNAGLCIALGALFVGLSGFLYLLSQTYRKIYSFARASKAT